MNVERKWDEPRPVLLTVDDFVTLSEAGAFDELGKVELIEGTIVAMNAQYSRHSRAQRQLFLELHAACAALPGFEAFFELSLRIAPRSMPRPELSVVRDVGANAPAEPDQVALAVEIADTTARYDLGRKARLYAQAGVAEYWVVDLDSGMLHQMWSPGAEGYAERREVALGERVEAVTIDGLQVETSDI
ncbi:MAG TPA: Uma2 family endonuclease [Sphingomonadaceae bacterium]|jgi:Uma2 family endonuclease|nr:Uma2 family endonuclease [Sphingomonadaceae bacterium]